MTRETRIDSPLGEVIVCHDEQLVGAATAAVLEHRRIARSAVVVRSLTRLLSCLHRGVDEAVVFDQVDEDVADLLEALRHRGLRTPVLIVADRVTPEHAARLLDCGAAGLVASSCTSEELCEAVVDVHHGNAALPEEIRGDILESLQARRTRRYSAQRQLAELSAIERRVLRGLSDGTTVTRIAADLALSPHTVRSHVRDIGAKLSARGQLRIAAAGRGLLLAARPPVCDLSLQRRDPEDARVALTS